MEESNSTIKKEINDTPKKKIDVWFIIGLGTVVYTAAGLQLDSSITWRIFFGDIIEAANKPGVVIAVVYQIMMFWNNPTTSGLDAVNSIKAKFSKR